MASFSVTFSNVLLALLYLLPGFLLCKFRMVRPDHLSTTSVILLYVCSPCMFINALLAPDPSPDLPEKMGLFILISLIGEVAMMLILRLFCGKRKQDFNLRMLSVASVMGNVGFFGLPVVRALFPESPEAGVYSCMFNISLNMARTSMQKTKTGRQFYILPPSMVIWKWLNSLFQRAQTSTQKTITGRQS